MKIFTYSLFILLFISSSFLIAKPKNNKQTNIKIKSFNTQYSGKNAWKSWRVNFNKGSATLSTKYSGKDAWKSWRITDKLNAPLDLKIASLIVIIYSGAIHNSANSTIAKSRCMLKGKKLYGKVKIVKYNPTFKVKVVDYNPTLKVKKVKYSANSCGKWEFVKYGEDFSIKFVDYNPDLKIKYVTYSEGMK